MSSASLCQRLYWGFNLMDKRTQLMTLETEVWLRGFAFYQRTMCYHLFSLEDVEMFLSVHVKLIFSLFCFLLFYSPPCSLLFCSALHNAHQQAVEDLLEDEEEDFDRDDKVIIGATLKHVFQHWCTFNTQMFSKVQCIENAVVLTFDSNTNRSLFFFLCVFTHFPPHLYSKGPQLVCQRC